MVTELTLGPAPRSAEAPLNTLLPDPVSPGQVTEALFLAAQNWGGTWSQDDRGRDREERAATHFERFRSEDWTWRR